MVESPCELIPHSGKMCLIRNVVNWDQSTIHCVANNHAATNHPLREYGQLSSIHGIEYAAQAMAVHAALLFPEKTARPGVVAAVKDIRQSCQRLDTIAGALNIKARQLFLDHSGKAMNMIYQFELFGDGKDIISGRITIMGGTE